MIKFYIKFEYTMYLTVIDCHFLFLKKNKYNKYT